MPLLRPQVRNEFYKDTQGAILVFDVSSRTSFEALSSWLGEMKDHVPEPRGLDSVVIAVCGNKVRYSTGPDRVGGFIEWCFAC